MECLNDEISEIFWYKDDFSYESDEINKELNSWRSPRLTEYISNSLDRQPLGEFMRETTKGLGENTSSQFFGFIGNELVSTVIITENQTQRNFVALREHIKNCSKCEKEYFERYKYLSVEKAEKILEKSNMQKGHDEVYIVIVDPKNTNKGYGTRVVSSITRNKDFFAPNSEHNSMKTRIYSSNYWSRAIFERNDFKKLEQNHGPRRDYFLNYFLEDDMQK